MIRKIQYAPMKPGRQPCTMVRKDFMFSLNFFSNLKKIHIFFFPKGEKRFYVFPRGYGIGGYPGSATLPSWRYRLRQHKVTRVYPKVTRILG